jgi:hypothetical protein
MNRTIFAFLIALGMLPALGCIEKHFSDEFDFENETITHLVVRGDSSDIRVAPGRDDEALVDFDIDYRGRMPDYDADLNGSTLKVKLDCGFSCNGDIAIEVPSRVSVDISVDSGNIHIRDIEGNARLVADSGNITMTNLEGDLDLNVDSGNIKGDVFSEVCDADLDSGNFSMRFFEVPRDLDLSADSGNIKVKVPSGDYNISTSVDSGNRDLDNVYDDPDSPNVIRASVDSGNIDIIGY